MGLSALITFPERRAAAPALADQTRSRWVPPPLGRGERSHLVGQKLREQGITKLLGVELMSGNTGHNRSVIEDYAHESKERNIES